jgi:hypothetical protein
MASPSLPCHRLNLGLLLTLILLHIGTLPYILRVLTMLLLLFIIGSLKSNMTVSEF